MHCRIALVLGLAGLFACSKTRESAVASDGARDTGCTEVARAFCTAFERCNPAAVTISYGDRSSCEKRLERECLHESAQPGSRVTNATLRTCAESLPGRACPVDRELESCRPPPGTLEDGATCVSRAQCEGGDCMRGKNGCGTCSRRVRRDESPIPRLGERCTGACELGSYCSDGVCAKAQGRKLGESCTTDLLGQSSGPQPCEGSLECADEGGKRVCVRRPTEGEPCRYPQGPACIWPAMCLDGACRTPSHDACTASAPKQR